MTTTLTLLVALPIGWALWSWAEYMLHRFAMHHLHGKGIMSREHLEHHVTSAWTFSRTHLLSWTGMLLVGALLWGPLGWGVAGLAAGVGLGTGWAVGYFFYEYQHMVSHLKAPQSRYQQLVRRHHFHHHFGAPMKNHGVSTPFWDRVFGTYEHPERVRVPRRLALPWLVDVDGEILPEFQHDYVLVGDRDASERVLKLDRARAFASSPPAD